MLGEYTCFEGLGKRIIQEENDFKNLVLKEMEEVENSGRKINLEYFKDIYRENLDRETKLREIRDCLYF